MTLTRRQFLSGSIGLIAAGQTFNSSAESKLKPNFNVPAGACDCHIHVVGPYAQFPMVPDRVYTPPECGAKELREHLNQLNLSRVVLIQPSFYGTDNSFQLLVAKEMGEAARVVVVIDEKTTDQELAKMVEQGARGVRMNISTSGGSDVEQARKQMIALANRIRGLKMHIQIYAPAKMTAQLADTINNLPVPVVLDHFASIQADGFQKLPELPVLIDLIRSGNVYVKLSAVYRVSKQAPHYENVKELAQTLVQTNVDRMIWASDWPHTNTIPGTPATTITPYRKVDDVRVLDLLPEWIPDQGNLVKVLVSNPARLYDF